MTLQNCLDNVVAGTMTTAPDADVALEPDVVAHKSTLLTIMPDAYVTLQPNVVPSSGVTLFLKECELVSKYLTGEADMRQPLSANEDNVVQTTRRHECFKKSFKMSVKKK